MRDRLIKATEAGAVLDLTRRWMPARVHPRLRKVSARQIRSLLLERTGGPLDPRGIRLLRARITGQLDLTDVRSVVPLRLEGCQFDEPVVLERAQMSSLSLSGSVLPALHADHLQLSFSLALAHVKVTGHAKAGAVRLLDAHITGGLDLRYAELTNHNGPALLADRLKVDSYTSLANIKATGHGKDGAVRLLGAQITSQLLLVGAELTNDRGPALFADGLQVDDHTSLAGMKATGHGEGGTVQLVGSHFTGKLRLTGAELTNHTGPALTADRLRVDSETSLADLKATGGGKDGAIRLSSAHITGGLDLRYAELTNHNGPALFADRLKVDSYTSLANIKATGHGEDSTVRLSGAHITGELDLRYAELTNHNGPALFADRLKVDSYTSLANIKATGHGEDSTVRLVDAHITGELHLTGAKLTNHAGPALAADRLRVDSSTWLADIKATGHGKDSTVRLAGAHIAGQFDLRRAELTNRSGPTLTSDTGPALFADRLQIGSHASLADLKATGHGEDGTVRLTGAHFAGKLYLTGAELTNHTGPALAADRLRVDSETSLADLKATGGGKDGAIRLSGAHITGTLTVSGRVATQGGDRVILDLRDARVDGALSLWSENAWHSLLDEAKARPRLLLEGFTYRSQPLEPRAETWLQVLQKCVPGNPPQPYRQLADVFRRAGDEERAKMVLIAQQDAFGLTLSQEDGSLRGARVWHWIARVTVRYGYRSGRALWFLLLVMAISCGLMLLADTHGWVVHPKARGGGRCGVVESIGFAVDRAVPLLGTIGAGRCELTNAGPAQWVFVAGVVLQLLSWAFLTLFVAGFTGIVRKPPT
ncbi:hypothetical protein [Streptomyces sp. Tu 3180]|uniref:hypothetical protein n=1 Tax=Streptomyces sp. Tu 3180 TaxID=2682611 RepID=UPI00135B91B5|nr:hypothetical protein [Streptomyces sp. Tu 3180]KAF3469971.1 hypothetical protein GL259_00045 [Streptomyces sp. Tu 3180]